ncbi:asparagine synthase (glutamine-hydrolyzing) [Streptosporangium sp. NPDC000396]|uniref:asparagine synthase (glutamine-hydrolyzing) n=1 Tax=Streptosporangium sp. NPDC000396 TaxID=3366185 RepID=UPI0036A3E184
MCGIAGLVAPGGGLGADELRRLAEGMAGPLRDRGPDDSGWWVDPSAGVGLAHTRLAVVDLSPRGRQPMSVRAGGQVLVCNGEVYNHRELRRELESSGHRFAGHSDSEVLAVLIDQHGLPAALERVNGAFALALWDPATRTLSLARDRIGEKPLYYAWCGGHFLFGSELKALRSHPAFRPELDTEVLALYFALGYVPAPFSIYRSVRKLRAGTILRLDLPAGPGQERITPYWDLREIAAREAPQQSLGERIDELDQLLRDSVALRSAADVPVGAFLSGGIDSSAVAALMTCVASGPVRTFTVGFEEPDFDERDQAAEMARFLGTEHEEIVLTASEALRLLPAMPSVYDEPFYDPAQLPTVLMSMAARPHVTVVQSGEGGDELFGGYPPYRQALRARRRALAAGSPPSSAFDIHMTRRVWPTPASLLRGAPDPAPLLVEALGTTDLGEAPAGLLLADALTWLPDNCLVKMDRATMSVGLEVRCPYLDPRIMELAWRTPIELKVREDGDKWILRQVLRRHLPEWARGRPKRGFNLPLARWLRGPLREWAEHLLDRRVLEAHGLFDGRAVRERWRRHLDGSDDHTYEMWTVLMFQGWLPYGLGVEIPSGG